MSISVPFCFFMIVLYVYYIVYWVKIFWKKQHRHTQTTFTCCGEAINQLLWKQTSWSPVRRQKERQFYGCWAFFVDPCSIIFQSSRVYVLHQLSNLLAEWRLSKLDLHKKNVGLAAWLLAESEPPNGPLPDTLESCEWWLEWLGLFQPPNRWVKHLRISISFVQFLQLDSHQGHDLTHLFDKPCAN